MQYLPEKDTATFRLQERVPKLKIEKLLQKKMDLHSFYTWRFQWKVAWDQQWASMYEKALMEFFLLIDESKPENLELEKKVLKRPAEVKSLTQEVCQKSDISERRIFCLQYSCWVTGRLSGIIIHQKWI